MCSDSRKRTEQGQHPSDSRCKEATTRFDFGPLAREYERWYETEAARGCDRIQKADVTALLPRPRAHARLLDVGCGTGHWSRFFVAAGYHVHGVDISSEMIAIADSGHTPRCSFSVADAIRLPFPDSWFDVVAAIAVLEFVVDQEAAVREMARCTRPGGTLLIGTLNRLAEVNCRRIAKGEEPYASARLLTPDELEDLLSPHGMVRMRASSAKDNRSEHHATEGTTHSVRPHGPKTTLTGALLVAAVQR